MGMHGGWMVFMHGDDADAKKKAVTWPLLKRVLGYARPYRLAIIAMLGTILATTGLGLLTPLIFRNLIDHALPDHDTRRLNILAAALVLIPIVNGGVAVVQRWLNAAIGEGVIYDLRVALYTHLQRLSMRFFTPFEREHHRHQQHDRRYHHQPDSSRRDPGGDALARMAADDSGHAGAARVHPDSAPPGQQTAAHCA